MAYCPKCGMQNVDTAIYCARCGSSMASAHSGGSPTVVVVGNNTQQVPAGSNPGTVWLWLNIILVALSCCTNLLGIIGIIFGGMAVSKYNQGLYAESKSNANVSKWMFWVSLILGVIGAIIAVVAGVLPMLFALIASIISSTGI